MKTEGLLFTGSDVIGGYLSEINVTSPTGLQQIARFDGVNLAEAIRVKIEAIRGWDQAARAVADGGPEHSFGGIAFFERRLR